jgi:RNA polymerase sigma-70 factor (ECF subfamily)
MGPWLPSPIETNGEDSVPSEEAVPPSHEVALEGGNTEGRYELLESVSFAFFIAREALDITESNVKTSHHRARRAMREYDGNRCIPTRTLQDKTRQIRERFFSISPTRIQLLSNPYSPQMYAR